MLVLTRKRNEAIMVGDDIKITVLEITPHGVRIGIEAPDNVVIARQELLAKLKFDLRAVRPPLGNSNQPRT